MGSYTEDGGTAMVAHAPEDFLDRVVTPLFLVLENNVALRAQPGKGYSSAVADRAMYDDVNEFFWQRENVDVLLGGHAVLRAPGKAYSALRSSLGQRSSALHALFRKTFYERPTWLSVLHTFQRYVILNAMAVHFMAVISYTHAICDAQVEAKLPDVTALEARAAEYDACLVHVRGGGFGWRALSTCTVTHSILQIIFTLIGYWVVPSTNRSWFCTCATWRSWLNQNFNTVPRRDGSLERPSTPSTPLTDLH